MYKKIKRILTNEEEIELFEKYNNGDQDALKLIVLNNIPLIINYVNIYIDKNDDSYDDIISSCLVALYDYINKFDNTMGYSFSYYFTSGLIKMIRRNIAMEKSHVKLKTKGIDKLNKINKILKESNYNYTYQTLSEKLDIKYGDVKNIINAAKPTICINDIEVYDRPSACKRDFSDSKLDSIVLEIIKLPIFNDKNRDIITKILCDHMSYSDIAYEYGVSRQAMFVQIERIIKKIKKNLDGYYELHDNAKLASLDLFYSEHNICKVETDKLHRSLIK